MGSYKLKVYGAKESAVFESWLGVEAAETAAAAAEAAAVQVAELRSLAVVGI